MSTTARASSVDTDVMEGEKIELDMSRQATAGAINQNIGFRRFGYTLLQRFHHAARFRHQLFERVPIARARGKKDKDHWRAAIRRKP